MALSRARRASIALGLLAGTLWLYAPVGDFAFVSYDDPVYVVDNPNLRRPLDAAAVRRAFTGAYESNWIPLTWLSLHADAALHGISPRAFHWTNAALHATSAALLFCALQALTGLAGPSAWVAAVFAAHPLHVESVAWVTERKDALCGLFWMLTVLAYAGYARARTRRGRVARYAAVSAALACALLSKPVAVTLPFALLLLDHWPLGRLRADGRPGRPDAPALRRAGVEKLPWIAMAAATGAIALAVQRESGAMQHGDLLPFSLRVANAFDAIGWYVRASFWPSGLAAFYPHPLAWPPASGWLSGVAVTALAAGVALRTARTRPALAVGLAWFLGTLLPVLGLVQAGMQARADRYTYLPLIGLAIAVAWSARDLARGALRGKVALVAALASVAALGVATRAQLAHWSDSESLYRRALRVTDDNFLAQNGLAGVYLEMGELERAEMTAREAVRMKPGWPDARVTLGDILASRGFTSEALEQYRIALELAPDHPRAHASQAVVLIELSRAEEALAHLDRALAAQRNTGFDHLQGLRGQALAQLGRLPEAAAAYRKALAIRPDWPEAQANLGGVLLRMQRTEDALPHLERAYALGLRDTDLQLNLGSACASLGRRAEAVDHYRAGFAGTGIWHPSANNLAWLLATRRDATAADTAEALDLASQTVARRGESAALLDTLATARAAAGEFERAVQVGERALAAAEREGSAERDAIAARVDGFRRRERYVEW